MKFDDVIKVRNSQSHKYDYGRLLCICGSYKMAGAAILCGKASLRSGIGLLDIALKEDIYNIVASNVHEAIYTIYESEKDLLDSISKANAIVLGCGMSMNAKNIVKYVLNESRVVSVLDADALNLIAQNDFDYNTNLSLKIITPHTQEMARLTNKKKEYIMENREEVAKEYAMKHNVIVVLKGVNTIVANTNGDIYINDSGNAGMATGGSGDVLAGIIAALLINSDDVYRSVCAAVYFHGLAGDICAKNLSMQAMLPSDIIEALPEIFKEVEEMHSD